MYIIKFNIAYIYTSNPDVDMNSPCLNVGETTPLIFLPTVHVFNLFTVVIVNSFTVVIT